MRRRTLVSATRERDDTPIYYFLGSQAVDTGRPKSLAVFHEPRPPPAVLLLDVRFEDHHGVEILRQIQADQAGMRVVMLTAYASIDDAIAAMRFGAIDYLTKPIDLNRLREIIDRSAATESTVLILGDSGTGKELVARALHEQTQRSSGPFVAINVAATNRNPLDQVRKGKLREDL